MPQRTRVRQQALKHQHCCPADETGMTQIHMVTEPNHVSQQQFAGQVDGAVFVPSGEVVEDRRPVVSEIVVGRWTGIGVFDYPFGCSACVRKGLSVKYCAVLGPRL